MKRGRVAAIGLGLLAVVLAGHGALWWTATTALERQAARWAAAQRAQGNSVAHGAPVRGGWPMAARLTLPAVALAGREAAPGAGTQWDLQAEAVVLELALQRPTELTLLLPGRFAAQAVEPGGATHFARGTASQARAAVPLRPGEPSREVRFALRGLRLDTSFGPVVADAIDLGLERAPSTGPEAPSGSARLTLSELVLPPQSGAALGERIEHASIEARLLGVLPEQGPLAARLAAWRDANGWVELSRVVLRWGPLGVSGTATLALDPALQPMGQAATRLSGVQPTLDLLAAQGVVPRNTAASARALLGFMSRTPAEGGPPVLDIALTLQDRRLSAGRIGLARLPEIAWPR